MRAYAHIMQHMYMHNTVTGCVAVEAKSYSLVEGNQSRRHWIQVLRVAGSRPTHSAWLFVPLQVGQGTFL